jgi:mono/diheme cytochrome c family protein
MRRTWAGIALSGILLFSGCEGGISDATMANGKKVYQTRCQSCHMENGAGVPRMNAPLVGSKYVVGEKEKLIDIVLHGSAAFANDPGRRYDNTMPGQGELTDKEIAEVLTYIRNNFNNKASAIETEDVKIVREKR